LACTALVLLGAAVHAQAWTVSLSVNKSSPQPVGTQITFTATVTGAWATPEYSFLASINNGGSWFALRDFSTSNQFVWTPQEARSNWRIAVKASMSGCDPQTGECSSESETSPYILYSTNSVVASVSLSANRTSGQPLGSTVTWTANPSGGTNPVNFKWLQSIDGGVSWSTLQDWAPTSGAFGSYVWTPSQAGTLYLIRVLARSATSTNPNGEASATESFVINGPPISSLTISSDRSSPQLPGTPVTWTASVNGGLRPLIYSWGVWANGTWITQTGATASNQFTWTPSLANTDYTVWVWVWSANMDPASTSAERSVSLPFSTKTTVLSVAVAPNRASPQSLGTSITWTATPNGGVAPYSYKWSVSTDGGGTWTTVQKWTAHASQFTSTPSVATTLYRVAVSVRSAGSTSDSGEATGSSPNFTVLGPAVSALTLTANKPSPQPPGTAITWTVTATGGTAPIYYYWAWRDWNGNGGTLREWSTDPQLVWTPSYVADSWEIDVSAASATADFEAFASGADEPEAGTRAFFSTATTVLSVSLAADRASGQSVGTTVTWTATPRGGTPPLSYKWLLSSDDGATWTTLQDWTTNANRYAWTPMLANSLYRIGVSVRSGGSTNSGEATNATRFAIVNGPVRSVTLTPNKPSPQPAGTPITWTASATGGSAPISYEWMVSPDNGATWTTLGALGTSNQIVWTPQGASSQFRVLVNAWSYDADFEAGPQATTSANYVITPRVSSVTLTPSRLSPQAVGTAITWTAVASSGTPPLSYKWSMSSNGGSTWSVLKDWTPNATQWSWTPAAVGAQYLFSVSVRSSNGSDPSGEATAYTAYVITDASGALVADGFTGANGTVVSGRTPEIAPAGVSWSVAGAGAPTIQSNQTIVTGGTGYVLATVNPNLADAIVSADIIRGSPTPWGGLVLRMADPNNFLIVRYTSNLTLSQVEAGQSYDLASSTPTAALAGSRHRLEARLQGDRIRVYWDGMFQFQATTGFQLGATRHGLAWNPSSSTTTSLDAFDLRPATITVTGPADRTDREETYVNVRVTATDSQGATLTYTASGLPPELYIDNATGEILGRLSADAAGLHTVTVRAAAGARFAERTVRWLVMCPASDYTVSPFSFTVPSAANDVAYVWVLTSAECPWAAISQSDFIIVTADGLVRTGTEEVQISYTNNPSLQSRVGTIGIAGQTVLLMQPGEQGSNCTIAVTKSRLDFNADGGSSSFSFTPSSTTCRWMVAAQGDWFHITGPTSGTGPATLTVTADRNSTDHSRTGYLAVNGAMVTIDQDKDQCTFAVEHTLFELTADNQSHDVQVYAGNGCGWDAWSNDSFVHITEIYPNNPAGPGHIRFSIESNLQPGVRVGTLSVARQTVTIVQAGAGDATVPNDGSTEDLLYFDLDALGSVRMLTDKTGAVQARYDFMPFGTEWQTSGSVLNSLRFTGQERDKEMAAGSSWPAQDYFGARYYQPQIGRFLRPDDSSYLNPFNPSSMNLYEYARNNPLRFTDPTGNSDACNPDAGYFCAEVIGLQPIKVSVRGIDSGALRFQWDSWWRESVPAAQARGFAQGIADSVRQMTAPTGPPSCYSLFVGETLRNLSPIPLTADPSVGDLIEPTVNTLAIVNWNRSVKYAASRPNYLGGRGLIYPNKSSVFRKKVAQGEFIGRAGPWVIADWAIWDAVRSEWNAASSGGCR
jgi:RHS repeat-associated protein